MKINKFVEHKMDWPLLQHSLVMTFIYVKIDKDLERQCGSKCKEKITAGNFISPFLRISVTQYKDSFCLHTVTLSSRYITPTVN